MYKDTNSIRVFFAYIGFIMLITGIIVSICQLIYFEFKLLPVSYLIGVIGFILLYPYAKHRRLIKYGKS